MIRIRLALRGNHRLVRAMVLTLPMTAGCASAPADRLAGGQQRMVRELTARCFRSHEGERLVFGDMQIHVACRHWAGERVRVVMPSATGLSLTGDR